ncbi:ICOS ligand-like [Dendrobates tinctorius]|uniref:ICOS ligand-like n=1 Tax=Dendrobates tinctorius TaxID=92724 RepID=UPI003CC9B034
MELHRKFSAITFCYLTFASGFVFSLLGSLRGSVELPCVYHQLPDAIEKINVYWQLRNHTQDLVVAAAMKGVVDMTFVDERFKGRAHLHPEGLRAGNFNLSLRNLSLHDSGTYVCIILWMPSYTDILNSTTVELEVTAEFSTPLMDIPEPGKLLYGQEVNLTCKSQGGLELPLIMWINSNDGSRIQEGRVHEAIHQDGDFINVMSTITLNITSNFNISCVIVTRNGNLTSQHYKMDITPEVPSPPNFLIIFLIAGGLVGVFLIGFLLRGRCRDRTPTYEVPSNQVSDLGSG